MAGIPRSTLPQGQVPHRRPPIHTCVILKSSRLPNDLAEASHARMLLVCRLCVVVWSMVCCGQHPILREPNKRDEGPCSLFLSLSSESDKEPTAITHLILAFSSVTSVAGFQVPSKDPRLTTQSKNICMADTVQLVSPGEPHACIR